MELDTVREEKAIRDLENRLVDSFTEAHSAEQVGSAVQDAHQRFDGRPIRDFVPILVERIVRRELDPEPVVEKVVTRIETPPENSDNEIVDSNSISRHLPETLRAALVSRGRLVPVLGVVGVLVVAAVAVAAVRDPEAAPAAAAAPLTVVEGVVGSEKMAFFDDPRVVAALAKHGLDADVRSAGSRQIATSVELDTVDFAFPSSLPAAERIQREAGVSAQYTPFSSPMVIATFQPIVDLLTRVGVVKPGPVPTFDVSAYLDMVARGVQWDQIEGNTTYPVRKNVLVSTTDPRSSNSAAMYLAVASYVANGNAVVRGGAAEAHVLPLLSRLFLAQGYTENSSEGPFGEYLAAGMGPAPMVWAYEAQYVAAAVDDRIKPEMVLLYPSPTVLSRHALVPLNEDGDRIGRLLSTDPELQSLAAEHGFRTGDAAKFTAVADANDVPVTRELIDVVDIPAYETLENLLTGVANSYN
ncbi:three-helix bundle dimerization domain-containing protein [Nocardia sp. NPDC059180]|uniref:three-helix bundle dimerization domain-containing protein n=1 Tax=Nocardia sp. NPDC059180 TaxID=3346761 RepID=UPI00368689B8